MQKIKVAIIGAGPSGLASAEVLRSKEFQPYFDITIYEANDYVGGKCCTIFPDGTVSNGKAGGYEMGATIITPRTKDSKSLLVLLKRFNAKILPYTEKHRPRTQFYRQGRKISTNTLTFSLLIKRPWLFFGSLHSLRKYGQDYLRSKKSRDTNILALPLSKQYSQKVNSRLAYLMQGFGYADLDDPYLTPPLLYYHQYFDPAFLTAPMNILESGTQGIWASLAAEYPKNTIRLSNPVQTIERSSDKVIIKSKSGSTTYDYVVVATPLKPALDFLDLTPDERVFLGRMKHNHYVSILCEVPGFQANTTFNLDACENRDQIGQVMCAYKRYPDSDIVTLYLYLPDDSKLNNPEIIKQTQDSLIKGFGLEMTHPENAKVYHWKDYFGHLDEQAIREHWYTQFEEKVQGKKRTLFVSSGLHMETVNASVEYATKQTLIHADKWLQQ